MYFTCDYLKVFLREVSRHPDDSKLNYLTAITE